MRNIDSPAALARLSSSFPPFAAELAREGIESYHGIAQSLAPVIAGYAAATCRSERCRPPKLSEAAQWNARVLGTPLG